MNEWSNKLIGRRVKIIEPELEGMYGRIIERCPCGLSGCRLIDVQLDTMKCVFVCFDNVVLDNIPLPLPG